MSNDAVAGLLPAVARRVDEDPHGPQYVLPMPASERVAAGTWCPLPDLGLLGVEGDDRVAFLQSQLTNDVAAMVAGAARWNGYCSPKGRLLGIFLAWSETSSVLLAVDRPQVEALRKRLSMFVLRSKARIVDATAQRTAIGLLGADPSPALARIGLALAPDPLAVAHAESVTAIRLAPVAGGIGQALQRVLVWVATNSLVEVAGRLGLSAEAAPASGFAPAPTALWRWAGIRAAEPRLFAATVEHFVPQMVNFELVGGVSFAKGCFPGQEVVARSQYLGKLKRRMHRARCAEPVAPATDVLDGGGHVVGEVVMSAPSPDGGAECLVESQVDALAGGLLSAGGQPLEPAGLPYAIPDAAPVRRVL